MKTFNSVLFDLDGVLIDSYQAWYKLLNDASVKFGYDGVSRDQYDVLYGQSVEADIDTLFPGLEAGRLKAFFEDHFFDYLGNFELMDGAEESISLSRELGFKTAIVTNTTKPLAVEIIKHLALEPDVLIGSGDAERDKPEPDLLLKACEKLESHPDESIMIGDSDFDSRAAASGGFYFVGYKRPGDQRVENHQELQELLKQSTAVKGS